MEDTAVINMCRLTRVRDESGLRVGMRAWHQPKAEWVTVVKPCWSGEFWHVAMVDFTDDYGLPLRTPVNRSDLYIDPKTAVDRVDVGGYELTRIQDYLELKEGMRVWFRPRGVWLTIIKPLGFDQFLPAEMVTCLDKYNKRLHTNVHYTDLYI